MAVVALSPGGRAALDPAFRWSLVGHGLLLLLVLMGGLSIPRTPPPSQLAIKATVVERTATPQPSKPVPPAPQSSPKPRPEPKPETKPDPKLEERRIEQQKVERQQAARREKVVLEKQRAEQLRAQQAAEKKQQEKLQRQKDEKQEQEKAAADKLQAEKLQAEKLRAAKAREEAAQREIARQLEAEEHLLAAAQSGALADYLGMISQKVTRNWIRPPSARAGLEAVVLVTQIPGGDVISAQIVSCNGDEVVCRSIQAAVLKASPLPLPDDPLLFDRSLRFTFKPEQ